MTDPVIDPRAGLATPATGTGVVEVTTTHPARSGDQRPPAPVDPADSNTHDPHRDVTPEVRAFGTLLGQAREARGMSMKALGKAANVSQGHISRVESGTRFPTLTMVYMILDGLRVVGESARAPFLDAYIRASLSRGPATVPERASPSRSEWQPVPVTPETAVLGGELQKRRQAADLSCRGLAHLLGTSATSVSRVEAGSRVIGFDMVMDYLAYCDVVADVDVAHFARLYAAARKSVRPAERAREHRSSTRSEHEDN